MKNTIPKKRSPATLSPKGLVNVNGGSGKYYSDILREIKSFAMLSDKACQDLVVIFDRLPFDYSHTIKKGNKDVNSSKILYVVGSEPLAPYVRDYLKSDLRIKSFLIPPFCIMSHLKSGSRLTMKSALQMANYVIVPSKAALRYLKVPAGTKVRILPPGVEVFDEVNPIENRKDIIVMLGRISPEKNYEVAIRILNGLKTSGAKLVIMGFLSSTNYDYYLYLRYLARKLGVHQKLVVLTNVSEDVKKKILNMAKVILHNRMGGLFEIGVAEAMSYGCIPIVCHGSTAWREVLRCGKYGLSYKTVNEATDLIKTLLLDHRSLRKYGALARERAKQLSFSNFRESLNEILEEQTAAV